MKRGGTVWGGVVVDVGAVVATRDGSSLVMAMPAAGLVGNGLRSPNHRRTELSGKR